MLSSASSSSSSSSSKPRRRKWTRDLLLRHLEILGPLDPLPPTLPPSPPASRPASPAPGSSKRKASGAPAADSSKRPRTGSFSSRSHLSQPANAYPSTASSGLLAVSNPHQAPRFRSETEEGEVRETTAVPARAAPPIHSQSDVSNAVPVRRPKRGQLTIKHYDALHETYHTQGRKLKYSGDARFWSTFSPAHKEYRPLLNPPPANSPYLQHGCLIARLELVHALVCFTYALWNRDYGRKMCHKTNWGTCEGFLLWCKQKWQVADTTSEKEKAFRGLIYMIEAFIQARRVWYITKLDISELDKVAGMAKTDIAIAIAAVQQTESSGGLLAVVPNATPPMLPSPASLAPASANSTPTNHDGGTPQSSAVRTTPMPSIPVDSGPPVHTKLLPSQYSHPDAKVPASISAAANTVTVPIGPQLIGSFKDIAFGIASARQAIDAAERYLTLPILARFYPRTFSRMVNSRLASNEEHEPDMEDDDGELLWPGQCITGEGLGWVCLMGKAMITEFGKDYGYQGLAGVVPKEDSAPVPSNGAPNLATSTHR